ncbi:MAG: TatD family deoxyribonuclease [Anaerolineaceae bacterium]|nr:MAG: TatD family deoxyribonuclease [Anaerolineaceae bacterium]
MRLVDTHCHLNFGQYDDDRQTVIERAAQKGVTRIINPAVDLESSRAGIALGERYEAVYAAVGVHPNSTAEFTSADIDAIRALADHPKVVAIGEIGLDYYWDKSPVSRQQDALQAQLDLAKALALPVIIHNRDASDDIMPVLSAWARDLPPALHGRAGVLHSFSASADIAKRALDAGFYIGFTGPLTFKKAEDLRDVARHVPLDRVLVETDAPFLTPEPYRGKRNEPAHVYYVADRLAALHRKTTEQMAEITTRNAERLFNIS